MGYFTVSMSKTFNTIEEAIKTWTEENEIAFAKTVKSGILCKCHCYKREDKIKNKSPLNKCTLLIPEKVYDNYVKYTEEKYKNPNYEFPYIAVLTSGNIRVRFYDNPRDDYMTKQNLCENNFKIEYLLNRYIGKKIRLAKNILVNSKDKCR